MSWESCRKSKISLHFLNHKIHSSSTHFRSLFVCLLQQSYFPVNKWLYITIERIFCVRWEVLLLLLLLFLGGQLASSLAGCDFHYKSERGREREKSNFASLAWLVWPGSRRNFTRVSPHWDLPPSLPPACLEKYLQKYNSHYAITPTWPVVNLF